MKVYLKYFVFVSLTSSLHVVNSNGINTCCSRNKTFNFSTRQCEKSESKNLQQLINLLSQHQGQVQLGSENLVCQYGMTDYDIPKSNVHVYPESIQIIWRQKTITLPKNTSQYCVDQSSTNAETITVRMCESKNNCNKKICLTKCTTVNHNVVMKNDLIYEQVESEKSLHTVILQSNSTIFAKIKRAIKKHPDYTLLIQGDTCEVPYLVKKRWHMTAGGFVRVDNHQKRYKSHRYCLDVLKGGEKHFDDDIVLFVCLQLKDKSLTAVGIFRGIILITSCFFILLTIIVHLILPSFRNTYGRCSLQHCICYFITFFCLAMDYFKILENTQACYFWGYFTFFFNIAIFSWLNILCYLIWNGIGRSISTNVEFHHNNKNGSNYIFYNLYAWGLPTVLSIATTLINNYVNNIPNEYKFNIDPYTCTFQKVDSYGEFIYYSIPMTILTAVNILFYIMTTITFNKTKTEMYKFLKSEAHNIRRLHKEQIYTSLKLMVIMGIPFINDTVLSILWFTNSSFFDNRWSVIFTSVKVVNSIQGVLLFIVIVMKRNILKDLKQKFTR